LLGSRPDRSQNLVGSLPSLTSGMHRYNFRALVDAVGLRPVPLEQQSLGKCVE